MSLSLAELAAARAFRADQRELLAARNADVTADVHVRHIRHDCAKRGSRSLGIELREHYVFSPEFAVYGGGEAYPVSREALDVAADHVLVRARRFGWIWTQGKCAHCGMTARSGSGRLVDPAIRPPAEKALVS